MWTANPLLPSGFDAVWSVVALALLVVPVVTLIALFRSPDTAPQGTRLLWALAIVALPLLGPALFWATRWSRERDRLRAARVSD